MTQEIERLSGKLRTATQHVRERAADLYRVSQHLAVNPSKLSMEEESVLEHAPELTVLVREMLALEKCISELMETVEAPRNPRPS